MRILILSNFYPPSRSWGYTQLCHEVVERLRARGHKLAILTSQSTVDSPEHPDPVVHRRLHLESDLEYYRPLSFFLNRRRYRQEDLAALREVVEAFEPEIIFIWGMWNITHRLPALAERLGKPVVYYLADQWPTLTSPHLRYWQLPARRWFMAPVKNIANRVALTILDREGRPPRLNFPHVFCVSQGLKEILIKKGVPIQHARVLYNGIDLEQFLNPNGRSEFQNRSGKQLRMLVAGRLAEEKGFHTAIEAVHLLVQAGSRDLSLTILGEGRQDYRNRLDAMVAEWNLEDYVSFQGRIPRSRMPGLLAEHDVLLLPSIYEEPLARMPMEAMAAGLVVVGTDTGGTPELIEDGQTGLIYPPGDAQALAERIAWLWERPARLGELAQKGQALVREKFNLKRMVDEIEYYLQEML